MLILDVNVVLAAHRADHPRHRNVRRWFDDTLAGSEEVAVPAMAWASFLRLATHPRIFAVPTPLADAFAFIDTVMAHPRHLALGPGPRHLSLVRQLCEEGEARGDLVPDAVLGAIAIEHGAAVVTLDRDFARFDAVRTVRPEADQD